MMKVTIYWNKKNASEDGLSSIEELRHMCRERQRIFLKKFKTFLDEEQDNQEQNDCPNFFHRFVECCTGSNYVPYSGLKKIFAITIEFNYAENHPKFHTCSQCMVLPGCFHEHYTQRLIDKIEQTVDLCCCVFGMQQFVGGKVCFKQYVMHIFLFIVPRQSFVTSTFLPISSKSRCT